jgi:hypothetical protein
MGVEIIQLSEETEDSAINYSCYFVFVEVTGTQQVFKHPLQGVCIKNKPILRITGNYSSYGERYLMPTSSMNRFIVSISKSSMPGNQQNVIRVFGKIKGS